MGGGYIWQVGVSDPPPVPNVAVIYWYVQKIGNHRTAKLQLNPTTVNGRHFSGLGGPR
jgi:hypothetical protein